MNNHLKSILALGFVGLTIVTTACNTTKKATKNVPPVVVTEPVKPNEFGKLYDNQFTYRTFSGKAQMHYVGGDQDQNFTANLKMEKDKKIWLSAVAMGIAEVARAQITPEKLQAIERINRNSYDLSFEEGLKKLNAPVEFAMLENLLIGNPVMQRLTIKNIASEGSLVTIKTEKDGYVQELVYDKNTATLTEQRITSDEKQFKCVVKYKDYISIEGQPFAKYREINIDDMANNKKTLLEMDFSKYDLNQPVDMPFSVPSGYKTKAL